MTDTATPETGTVDAPASADSIAEQLVAEIAGGEEAPADGAEAIAQELVNEAEETPGDAVEAAGAEDDATDPAVEAEVTDEGALSEQMFTVKVNGEDREVPLTELLKGYSREADYTAKTEVVAQQRREVEAQRANMDAELKAQYASQLEQATSLFAQFDPVLSEARNINWEALKQTDPAAYVQAQEAVSARLTAIQQMQGQVERLRGERQQRQQEQTQQERAERFDRAAEKLVETMPELADEAKFQQFAGDAIGHLKAQGFTSEEIGEVLDERVLTLADKARRWDAHVAAQKALPEKRIVPKSAVKPLTTDGSGSRATPPRFNPNAPRERKVNWVVNQLLDQE